MCGIAGYWNKYGASQNVAERMIHSIVHRGPDAQGFFTEKNISLGSCRLSIVDLETGDQPIFNEDKTIAVVFNGEIYNFLEIRERLIKQGHVFKTKSDTETIVHLYEERGFECLQELNGMFAFALWDAKKNILFVARDRLGVKPLWWSFINDQFSFASELKGLLYGIKERPQLNTNILSYYFTFGFIPTPHTIYKNIFKLEPAHYVVFNGRDVVKKRYWHMPRVIQPVAQNDAVKTLYRLTEAAVERRLIADVPLGAFLSGGFDSSVVVGLMKQLVGSVETFSIGFEGTSFFNELPQAQRVAEHFGVKNYSEVISAKTVKTLIPQVLDNLDEPFGDSSIIPTHLLSHITRKKVKVALSGDGGDELFVGYEKYRGHYWNTKRILPPFLLNLLTTLPVSRESRVGELFRKIKKFKTGAALSLPERHFIWSSIFSPEALLPGAPQAKAHYVRLFEGVPTLEQALMVDATFNLPDDMLVKVDMASMANSLEVRSPFLDYTLFEFMFRLPSALRFQGGIQKYLAKQAFKELLPDFVLNYRKQGFEIPVGEWLRSSLKDQFIVLVQSGKKQWDGLMNFNEIDWLFKTHIEKKADNAKILWSLFCFFYWTYRSDRR